MPTSRVTIAELRKMTPGSLERHEDLVDAALEYLTLNHIAAAPIATTARVRPRPGGGFDLIGQKRGQLGMADIMACLQGQLLLIDCKTGGAHLSASQRAFRARFEASGALYLEMHDTRELDLFIRAARLRHAFGPQLGGGKARLSSGVRPTGAAGGPPPSTSKPGGQR